MKVYLPPKAVEEKPEINYGAKDFRKEFQKEEVWADKIKEWAKTHGKGRNKGKEVNFPYADGRARYVIFEPNALIHLPIGDAWQYPYIERLRASDISQLCRFNHF